MGRVLFLDENLFVRRSTVFSVVYADLIHTSPLVTYFLLVIGEQIAHYWQLSCR